jgi:hypothetical protein
MRNQHPCLARKSFAPIWRLGRVIEAYTLARNVSEVATYAYA